MGISRKRRFFLVFNVLILISIALFVRAYYEQRNLPSDLFRARNDLVLSQAGSISASLQESRLFEPASGGSSKEDALKDTKETGVNHVTRTGFPPADILLPVASVAASDASVLSSPSIPKQKKAKIEQSVTEPVVLAAIPKILPWEEEQNPLPQLHEESEREAVGSRSKKKPEEINVPFRGPSQKKKPSDPMGTILALTPGDREVTLTWDAAHGGNGFSVYYGTSPSVGPESGVKKFCPATPCTIAGLKNGEVYYFAVEENVASQEERMIVAVASAIPTNSVATGRRREGHASDALHPENGSPDCGSPCPGVLAQEAAQAAIRLPITPDCAGPCIAPTLSPSVDTLRDAHVSAISAPLIRPEVYSSSPFGKKGVVLETVGKRSARNIATGASGNAVAVWQQAAGGVQGIWASLFKTSWGHRTLISTNTPGDAFFPQVAIDSSGRAMAVWYQSAGTRYDVWANRFTPDGGWGTATRIQTENTKDALFPRVAIDPQGRAVAVWYQSDGVRYNIWANRFTPDAGWGDPVLIEENGGNAFSPSVGMDSGGNAVAVWYQSDGRHYNIWANRFIEGSGWKVASRIATGSKKLSEAPQVLVDPLGNAIVAWRKWEDTGANQTWINSFVVGLGWGSARALEADPSLAASMFK